MQLNFDYTDVRSALENNLNNYISEINELKPDIPNVDKWVLASAMQKAIRRGEKDNALNSAFRLSKIDNVKCWKRLSVVHLEDIAFDDISHSYSILWAGNHPSWRRLNYQGDKLLVLAIENACSAHKSRIANDLLSIANRHPNYTNVAGDLSLLPNNELGDFYLDESNRLVHRAIAAWYLCGVQPRRLNNMKERQGNWRYFLDLHSVDEYPPDLIKLMKRGFGTGEGHARTLALTWKHRNIHRQVITTQDETLDFSSAFNHVKSEAFDIHTRLGKQAYRHIVKGKNELSDFLIKNLPDEDHVRILGMGLFAIEGMLLNKREIYPGVLDILHEAIEAYLAPYNVSGSLKERFLGLLSQNMELIHVARHNALQNAGLTP